MTTWQATVDLLVTTEPTEDQIDDLVTHLEHRGAAIAAGGGSGTRINTILTVPDAPNPIDACSDALGAVRDALAAAGLQIAGEIGVEAITDEEADRRLAEPVFPDLVAATEAASILGVSRQRVHQLAKDNARFPEPALHLALGPLWTRFAVERFNEVWERKPGRPFLTQAAIDAASDRVRDALDRAGQRATAHLDSAAVHAGERIVERVLRTHGSMPVPTTHSGADRGPSGSSAPADPRAHHDRRSPMSGNVHTVPSSGGWENRREGAKRASSTHATKAEAQARGRQIAENAGVEHVIHKKDGTIGERNSYGNDPHPPKG